MSMLNLMKGVAQASGVVGVTAWLAQESLYNVDGGERAVMFDRINGCALMLLDRGLTSRYQCLSTLTSTRCARNRV